MQFAWSHLSDMRWRFYLCFWDGVIFYFYNSSLKLSLCSLMSYEQTKIGNMCAIMIFSFLNCSYVSNWIYSYLYCSCEKNETILLFHILCVYICCFCKSVLFSLPAKVCVLFISLKAHLGNNNWKITKRSLVLIQ